MTEQNHMKLCKNCKWFDRNWLKRMIGFQEPKCVRPGLSTDMIYGKPGYRPCEVERDRTPAYGCGNDAQYWEARK